MIGINKGALGAVNPNLKLELKFNYQTYTDVAATVAANTNDYVRAWRSTVNSSLFTQSTDAARPQRVSDGLYFDGGDYVAIAHNSGFMDFGTGNFTVEAWVNFANTTTENGIFSQQSISNTHVFLRKNTNNTLQFAAATSSTVVANYVTASAISVAANTWYHIALVRNGSTVSMYLSGISQTLTLVTAIGTMPSGTGDLYIGVEYDLSGYFVGKITDFRIYKGVAQYTANFTPPTRNA